MSADASPLARVALIGNDTFRALKGIQDGAPGPRLEMRYWIEGMAAVIRQDQGLASRWLRAAREAVFQHLQTRRQADLGTGDQQGAEGAMARTVDAPPRATGGRHDDCKALQIGEATFQWLKGVQGTTRDPRIEIRYLLEGAVALFLCGPEVPTQVVKQARRALLEHLATLENIPLDRSTLEKSP